MIVDLKKTAAKTGINDTSLLKSLIGEFFSVCQKDVDKLKSCVDKKDFESVRQYAHNVKGAAKNMWLEEIGAAAEVLEAAAKGAESVKLPEYYKNLSETFENGKKEFEKLS